MPPLASLVPGVPCEAGAADGGEDRVGHGGGDRVSRVGKLMVVVKAVILTILILLSLLNDTSLAVPGALAQCLQCRRGLSNGHSFEKSRRQRKEKQEKKR